MILAPDKTMKEVKMSVREIMRLQYYSNLEDENEKLKEQNERLIKALGYAKRFFSDRKYDYEYLQRVYDDAKKEAGLK